MRSPSTDIRIAVTGMGVVCAIGANQEEVWSSIEQSRDGIGPLSKFEGEVFPTSIAAEVAGDVVAMTGKKRTELKRLSRTDLLAIAAVKEAVEQAGGLEALPLSRTAVSSGTSTGGLLEGEDFFLRRKKKGAATTPVSSVLQQPTSGPSDAVAQLFGFGGGVFSNATACASGGAAIGIAGDLLRSGQIDAAIAGGSDSLCRLTYSGFNVLQAVDANPCTPFDRNRQGITLGEGAGYLVLERWDDAVARGAVILAELGGYGASCDAHHPPAPAEDGRGAAAAMRGAIADGAAEASSIDYVNAHGTGTLLNDSAESNAIRTVVGDDVPASSSKSFFGHTLGAAGGIEAVVSILALRHQTAPPTLRFQDGGDECPLDYVARTPRVMSLEQVLSNTFGFGGSNVSLLFRSVNGDAD
jgi:3-oxoacyl-[acyl-carrier-protein] synthase II